HRLPVEPDQAGTVLGAADGLPRLARPRVRMGVGRGRDDERVALGEGLAGELEERVLDARVVDAAGREQKFQGIPSLGVTGRWLRLRSGAEIIGATSSAITSNHT